MVTLGLNHNIHGIIGIKYYRIRILGEIMNRIIDSAVERRINCLC